MKAPIDSKNAGLRNERLLLSLLRQHGELSQAQLCKLAGLSSSTASYIVGRLRQKGLIREKRGQSKKRGAKPVLLSIEPRGQLAVGVEISPSGILVGLFDFNCQLIETIKAPLSDDHQPRQVVDQLEINLRGLLGRHGVDEEKLVGIGVTLSGSIAPDGTVELSSPLGWKEVALKQMLQTRFRVPLSVHSTRVRLLAEGSAVPNLRSRNILLLNIGNGVGASMIVDGHLVHGATNRSGEVGHIIFDPNGPQCGCGHRGCLETLISGPALASKIKREVDAGAETMLKRSVHHEDLPENVLEEWGRAIRQGDQYSLELRDYVANFVSQAAAIAINCYDPNVVILAGYVCAQCPEYLVKAITRKIATDVYDSFSREITILPARVGEEALVRGVAAAILRTSLDAQ